MFLLYEIRIDFIIIDIYQISSAQGVVVMDPPDLRSGLLFYFKCRKCVWYNVIEIYFVAIESATAIYKFYV